MSNPILSPYFPTIDSVFNQELIEISNKLMMQELEPDERINLQNRMMEIQDIIRRYCQKHHLNIGFTGFSEF